MPMNEYHLAWARLEGRSGHEVGRILLEELWRAKTGMPMPEIAVAEGGKPYFLGSKLQFSISHSKNHAFCVLSPVKVGIDGEEKGRKINLRLAEKILSPAERLRYEAAPDKTDALLRLWVLKEASVKLTGEGLRGYPNHTDFSLDDPRVQVLSGCIVAVVEDQ